ncbi:MAG: leucine-rich repeat domain-containing protein [Ruminococcaceae bacterium]|nr:leucine-rich repeat domain-containing protein [Oscillospiraceae bacterium]
MKALKRIAFVAFLVILVSILALSVSAEKESENTVPERVEAVSGVMGSLTWSIDDAGNFVIMGNGAMTNYSFFSYDMPWYNYNSNIKTILIGHGITHVGDFSFVSCYNLTKVQIAATVQSIGSNAFYGCTKLTTLMLCDGLVSIESSAFNGCNYLYTLALPSTLREIGASAFYDCRRMYSLTLNNGLETIGSSAFKDCDALTAITIPDSVTEIGDNAFSYCDKLSSVTFGKGAKKIGNYSFEKCTVLNNVIIPAGVKNIGHCAFAECPSLTAITLPDGLETIESSAFEESGLKSVSIPDSVTALDSYAFRNCDSLESVSIGKGIETMNWYAFAKCDNLTKATLAEGLALLGARAFYECPKLCEINFPKSLRSIGECCFSYDNALTDVKLNDGLEAIEYSAFSSCSGLVSIYIPKSVSTMATQIFSNTKNVTVYCYENSTAHNYAVTNSLKYELISSEPSVAVNDVVATVINLHDIRDIFIAKGYYDNYTLVNVNKIVRITEAKLAGATQYSYTLPGSGDYTVLIRYNDGTMKFLYTEVSVTEPVFTQNNLRLNVANLNGIKVIRTALGEHKTAASIKRTEGARAFTAKDVLKDKTEYTIQYREEGLYTVAVCYENGYSVFYKYNVTKKTPVMTREGNKVIFDSLDDLKVIRYARGEYTTSGDIKRAEGSVALTANKAVNGKITVSLKAGTYTFCVQYNDESYNYYTVVVM